MKSVLDDCLAQFSSKYVPKEERRQAVLGLLDQEYVVAVLTTGFGKILIYQLFAAVKLTGALNVNFWKISVRKMI